MGDWDDVWRRVSPGRSWAKRRIVDVLARLDWEKDGDVMDLGCGSGALSAMMGESFPEARLWLVDSSERAIELARENVAPERGARFVQISFEDMGSGSAPELDKMMGRFSLVYTDGLLEHFPRAEQGHIITVCRRLLADGGLQVHVVPNRYHPWQLVRPFVIRGIPESPFTRHDHRAAVAAAGLSEELEGHGGISVLPTGYSPEGLGEYVGMLRWFALRRRG
jgi:SAM-dependent methyltransferase